MQHQFGVGRIVSHLLKQQSSHSKHPVPFCRPGGLGWLSGSTSSTVTAKWPKHSMSLCQVPSCLVSGPSWSLCSASVRFCVRCSVGLRSKCLVESLSDVVWVWWRLPRPGRSPQVCVCSVTSCRLQWLPPTEKATWSQSVCLSSVSWLAASTTQTWKHTPIYKHLSVSI